jgi:hypothetical protein
MVVKMSMLVFWVVTPHGGLVGRYQRFGETVSTLKMEVVCSSKMLVSSYKST